ncbi:hypothetical protein GCM10015535_65700 [Streptomyces gelaticus]|uniref:Uncharacterized protein n=1 Tax=Streptomyces gelaticus TaxID=285446 RepID=A0ABQ2W905_9ACTN|nr:hypothetical protein GCM10015535_65700 [Streptomyces gelaticus]
MRPMLVAVPGPGRDGAQSLKAGRMPKAAMTIPVIRSSRRRARGLRRAVPTTPDHRDQEYRQAPGTGRWRPSPGRSCAGRLVST